MKRVALLLALLGGVAQPAFAQTAISTDSTGGYVGFAASLTSPSGSFRRGLITAVTCVDSTGVYTGCGGTGGGGGSVPTGTAGTPNAAVVTVQGISGGTPQNTTVSTPLPAGTNAIGSITNITGAISLPTGASTSANQTTEIASLAAIQARSAFFSEVVNGTLAASTNFTGATRDAGVTPSPWASFSCYVTLAQGGGGLALQHSTDGTTWYDGVTVVAANPSVGYRVSDRVDTRYNRCQFRNSTTAVTSYQLNSSFGTTGSN